MAQHKVETLTSSIAWTLDYNPKPWFFSTCLDISGQC